MWSVYGWLFNFFLLISVLATIGYQIICLKDLELDYINPYDAASNLKIVVLVEYFTQGALCIAFLFTGHWFFCILSLPYLFYNVRLFIRRQEFVDVTEIYNKLDQEMKRRLFKLGYLMLLLVWSIFWLLYSIGDEVD